MNWLRAKARHDRWREQLTLVVEEMKQTIRSFEFKADEWSLRSGSSFGAQCYARKQEAVWSGLANRARTAFTALTELGDT